MLSADKGRRLHKTTDLPPPTHLHTFPTHTNCSRHTDVHYTVSGFSDILLNHAGPESQKKSDFIFCRLLISLSSIRWLFTTFSHKSAACLERAGSLAANHCSALSNLTAEMMGKFCYSLQKVLAITLMEGSGRV